MAVEGRPRRQVRPDARLLDEERKLLTHAIRIAAYNAESTLARMLRPHYSRADDEACALLSRSRNRSTTVSRRVRSPTPASSSWASV